ncbi:MAG: GGDEF domain-containing protein [Candidatus Sedimenticola sp. (ex Thyasira tokunagai)]
MRLGTKQQINDDQAIDSPDYLRSRLCIASLYLVCVVLSVFLVINLISRSYQVSFIVGIILLATLATLTDYYRHQNLNRMSNAGIGILYLFLVPLPLVAENHDYTLIWTLFFPVFAIIAKGGYIGLLHTAIFYIIIFTAGFLGIGTWRDGAWNTESMQHFVPASLMLTFLVYYFKQTHDLVHEKLSALLRNEKIESRNLQEITATDPLTGLRNRRHIEQIFITEANRAKRYGHYLGFFIFDIDHFKRYNDQLGQKMGDKALQTIANIFQAGMRRGGDYTFRLGGEEFGGLMVVERKEEVMPQVERLRRAVEAIEISYPYEGERVNLTISAGVLITDGSRFDNADDIFTAADSALYGAKREGRNRVVLFRGG